jgi:tetratricopeptide (TPR) repeat protein
MEFQISTRSKIVLVIALQFTIYVYVLWSKEFLALLLSVPLNVYLHKIHQDRLLYLLVLQLIFIDYFIGYQDFGLIAVFIAVGLLVRNYTNKKSDFNTIILSLLTIFLFYYNNFLPLLNTATILVTALFFYTVERKLIFSFIVTFGTIIGAVYFKDTPTLGLLMLSVIILKNVTQKRLLGLILQIAVFVSTLAIIIHPSFDHKLNLETEKKEKISISNSTENNSENIAEGRSLSYIENPLIGDHSNEALTFTGLSVLGTYLYLNVFPYQLSFYYGYSEINICGITDAKAWLSLLIYIILITIALWKLKEHPLVTIGILWYVASILLFSNWVELVAGVIGERLSYTASAGFSIFIGGLLYWISPDLLSKKRKFVSVAIVLVFIILFIKTIERNTLWANPIKLMSSDIKHLGNSAQANNMLAIVLMSEVQKANSLPEKEKLLEKALSHFKKTISIYPNFFNAHIDIARVYILQGQLNEAKRHLVIAYTIDPKSTLALEELVKINFDTNNLYALVNYVDQYLKLDKKNQLVYELVTHLLFVNSKKSLALKYANLGLAQFPQNQTLLYIINNLSYQNGN